MVVTPKHSTDSTTMIEPAGPSRAAKESAVRVTPLMSPPGCQRPAARMTNAVAEQTSRVSMIGPNMATKPSRIGSRVRAAPWAMASVPMPASLEKAPRRTP